MTNSQKPKILMCSEASFLNSGFSKYAYEILSRLHRTGKYTIAEFAAYGMVNDPRDKKIDWIYYANAVNENDSRYKEYKSRTDNQFGRWRFEKVLLDFKPDIVIDVRDYWMAAFESVSPLRSYFYHILMPTVDSAPQQDEWIDTFIDTDAIFTYSDWGAEILKEQSNNKINYIATTSPGVDLEIFNIKDQKAIRNKFSIPEDSFIVGSVMRNQKRKLIPELLDAFSNLLSQLDDNEIKKTFLYLHTSYPDMGWDIPELLTRYKIANKVLFTYICKNCQEIEVSTFCGPQKICNKCINKSSVFSSVSNGVSETQLSEIYNIFDIYVQYAICEGFGMPQVEAGACGLQIATVDYSAMTDIIKKLDAHPIKIKSYFQEIDTKAIRVYPDNSDLVNFILTQLRLPKPIREKNKSKIRKLTEQYYNWDNISKIWENYLDSITFRADWAKPLPIIPKPNLNKDDKNFNKLLSICNNTIKNISYMSSSRFLQMLQNADYGFSQPNVTQISSSGFNDIMDFIETLATNNNKSAEVISKNTVFDEDFIQYAKLKQNT